MSDPDFSTKPTSQPNLEGVKECHGVFVTGTDTGVGKTWLSAAIARHLRNQGHRVGAYKPVASGGEISPNGREVWEDAEQLAAAIGHPELLEHVCPQRFRAPLAPPVAARKEGQEVDGALLRTGADWWRERVDLLIVEGVGGLLAPLTETQTVADLACDLGFPLIIVARIGLGTINHTLLTVEAALRRGLRVAGIVLNQGIAGEEDPSVESNPAELSARCDVPILGVFPQLASEGLLQHPAFVTLNWYGIMTGRS